MNHLTKTLSLAAVSIALVSGLESCSTKASGNFQGREYMPDMAHSVAYESNTFIFYNQNRWGGEDGYTAFYKKYIQGAKPQANTIARGQRPHHYKDTEEERTRAMAEIVENPIKPTNQAELDKVLKNGKHLYNIYCSVCHGETGNGNGVLYNNGDGKYPNKPANYLSADFLAAGDTDGRYYHAIVYGKNVMMPHADKLNFTERWEVIHYIRALQAADKKQTYDVAASNRIKPSVSPVLTDSSASKINPVLANKEVKKQDKKDKKGNK
jgi:mono/diheme cytochrome c family protein